MKKRILSLVLAVLMIATLLPVSASAASPDDTNVLLKQNTNYTCTLCSAAMMLRRRAIIDGMQTLHGAPPSASKQRNKLHQLKTTLVVYPQYTGNGSRFFLLPFSL